MSQDRTAARRHALWIARSMGRVDLSPLRPSDLEGLQRLAGSEELEAGTLLMARGSTVDRVFVVHSGLCHLTVQQRPIGRRTIALVKAGGVIADIPLFCEKPMPFDALTAERSRIIVLPAERFLNLLQSSPALAVRWTTSVAKRLEEHQRRMIAILTRDLPAQVATILLEERQQQPDGTWVVGMAQGTIAELLGARRQSVARRLREFRDAGLIKSGYRSITLHDLPALADVAGESLDSIPCAARMSATVA